VCTEAEPCEKVASPPITAHGAATRWQSSQSGDRFKAETLNFVPQTTNANSSAKTHLEIKIDRNTKYQEILGFGGAFTDSTGINIKKMSAKLQENILRDYFSADGLEYNVGRIPIAGSDFSTRAYSYDDVDEDKTLSHFSLTTEDHDYKIPFIKKANAMATHEIRLFGSPWSAPKWMKTNNNFVHGGTIKGAVGSEYWQIYAKYFVKYLDAYKAEGINHWGITVQNEPLASQSWNSMQFSPESTRDFLKLSLGPELQKSGYGADKLKVMILDHNLSLVKDWVSKVFADKEASKYAHGTAIHWYGHDPKPLLDEPHNQHPDKFFLATEACQEGGVHLGDWKLADLYGSDILGDLIHHTIGWVDWNLVLDTQGGPNWVNNFVDAPIIVDAAKHEYYRQPSFYALGHFSKFLPPGSVRIGSTTTSSVNNKALVGAFRTPKDATVVIVVNTDANEIDFVIEDSNSGKLITKIASKSIQSYIYYD